MKIKKSGIILLLIVLTASALVFSRIIPKSTFSPSLKNEVSVQTQIQTVDVVLNFGDGEKTAKVVADNAFAALLEAGKQLDLEVKTKHYDFGDLVETIGGKTNTKDQAWIYFINGVIGDTAAEKKNVKAGDKVEWKYVKPN